VKNKKGQHDLGFFPAHQAERLQQKLTPLREVLSVQECINYARHLKGFSPVIKFSCI
jgi:hypothetical protein